jgi:hypothetical protein
VPIHTDIDQERRNADADAMKLVAKMLTIEDTDVAADAILDALDQSSPDVVRNALVLLAGMYVESLSDFARIHGSEPDTFRRKMINLLTQRSELLRG